jgi:hypothetical protein
MKTVAKIYQCYPNDSVIKSFVDRLNGRPEEFSLRKHNRKFIVEFAHNVYNKNNDQKISVRWDNKLGCACGCSPGFRILTERGAYSPKEYYTDSVLQNASGIRTYP